MTWNEIFSRASMFITVLSAGGVVFGVFAALIALNLGAAYQVALVVGALAALAFRAGHRRFPRYGYTYGESGA
jgi:hypothetical protein